MHWLKTYPQTSRSRIFLALAVFWLIVLGLSLVWNWREGEHAAFHYAESVARTSHDKDLVYRRWAAMQGGLYVKPSEYTPPNPYLAHLPDRDLTTIDGRKLTLVNPAYMTRQVVALGQEQYGIKGHITSLIPINPDNAPDAWEAEALASFARGQKEALELVAHNGEQTLRLIKPMVTEKPCLKCHAQQGYREGDIRGGISVAVPFAPYREALWQQRVFLLLSHVFAALLGFLGLWQGNKLLRAREVALFEHETRHRLILETAMDGFFVLDQKGLIIEVNAAYLHMSGYQRSELIGVSLSELAVDEPPEIIDRQLREIETGGEALIETRHRAKDGRPFDIAIHIQANPGLDGQFVAFVHDITEEKRAAEVQRQLQTQLQHAQKMEAIGTLAGGIAHDFNNLLGIIIGYAEIARDECAPGWQGATDLEQVIIAGNRAKELVAQILAFSRQTESQKIQLWPANIVKESLKLLRPSLPATIDIRQDIEAEAGPIHADPTQIHQLLMNLCTNAFHAMEETGGTLTVTIGRSSLGPADVAGLKGIGPGEYVRMAVEDTGPGIAPDIVDRIFEPYFTTKPIGRGTGMGLSIVHGIVTNHQGTVACRSQPGQGAVFEVLLPVAKEQGVDEESGLQHIPMGSERILLVDDEQMLAAMSKSMAERLGYSVVVCTDSFKALETFIAEPGNFDLVISDQTMPGMTGMELAEKILAIRPGMPIILCTGYSSVISKEQAMAAGIRAFLMKPVTKTLMAEVIRRVLDGDKAIPGETVQ